MHTYVIRVELVGSNDKEDVDKVKKLFEEALRNTKVGQDTIEMKSFMNSKLPDLISKRFILWCDPAGKSGRSYFLNIYVHGNQKKPNILMSGAYWSLDSLKNIATLSIAKQMKINTDVDKLDIPDTLKTDVNMICRQLNKEIVK